MEDTDNNPDVEENAFGDTSVRVAVRIRPQLGKERVDMCQICTTVLPEEKQLLLGKDKAFTYDFVFDRDSEQHHLYDTCSRPLIEGCLEGYNATIFAYGQTGSGKTYTMGTGFDVGMTTEEMGIIPRAVEYLFLGIDDRRKKALNNNLPVPDFKVNAQFMELYNEEILDLLDTTRDPSEARGKKSHIRIHEDAAGGIYTVGVMTRVVNSLEDTMQCLKSGALCRTTASTNMNSQSSRSHAIFTLHIRQQRAINTSEKLEDGKETDTVEEPLVEFETLTAKFHFVDLAGSERLKRTGATGDRAKEGISINCGLLALGNVISALGDQTKKGSHVPYRDSKLTRLLQDSLGGNSRTVMIACASPSDRDFMETLSTLKYANRARNIKNKVVVNQDKTSRQIAALRDEIRRLETELLEYKQGKRLVNEDGIESINDMFHENTMLQTDNNNLRQKIKVLQETNESLTSRNTTLALDHAKMAIPNGAMDDNDMASLLHGYVKEIETLRSKLLESDATCETIKRSVSRTPSRSVMSPRIGMTTPGFEYNLQLSPDNQINDILECAKQDVKQMKQKLRSRCNSLSSKSDKDAISEGGQDEKIDNDDNDDDDDDLGQDVVLNVGDEEDDTESDDDDDDDDDDDESSTSESEETSPSDLHQEINILSDEINIKENLIEELQNSQKQIHTLKMQYDEKLTQLKTKIREAEHERDQVLSNLGNIESTSQEQANKIKKEYEKKINSMQYEMKKVQVAQKENAKLLRSQGQHEKQIRSLSSELGDLKKTKVKLINQMKTEVTRNKEQEARRGREISKLRKEQRIKDNKIKTLEANHKQKEIILRRKQEEVEALRKRQKPMSSKAAGRVGKYEKPPTRPLVNGVSSSGYGQRKSKKFSSKLAKNKWDTLQKYVETTINKRQVMSHLEKDMDIWLKRREVLGKKLEKLQKRRRDITTGNVEGPLADLENAISNVKSEIGIVQDQISECQDNIVQMEEDFKDENDYTDLVNSCKVEECRYLLEHFITLTIAKGVDASQKDTDNKELAAKLHSSEMNSSLQQQLLQHVIRDQIDDLEIFGVFPDTDEVDDNNSDEEDVPVNKNVEVMPIDRLLADREEPAGGSSTPKITESKKDKARRKTATPEDLLYSSRGNINPVLLPVVEEPCGDIISGSDSDKMISGSDSGSVDSKGSTELTKNGPSDVQVAPSRGLPPKVPPKPSLLTRPSSAPVIHNMDKDVVRKQPDSAQGMESVRRKLLDVKQQGESSSLSDAGLTIKRKAYSNRSTPEPSPILGRKILSKQSSSESSSMTPPTSPSMSRRHVVRDENVFSRLTNVQPVSPLPNRGKFVTCIPSERSSGGKNFPLLCKELAEGHTRGILCLYATNDVLFSGSADRTVKVWDIESGKEVMSLEGHPLNVTSVKYSEYTRLVYSVAGCYVKVWDLRDSSSRCIRTLISNGLQHTGAIPSVRQTSADTKEAPIQDLLINRYGTVLYTAAGNTVKIWDLKKFASTGKFSGGHQAAVMAMAMCEDNGVQVVTGSKDHYIKVYEVDSNPVGVFTPKYHLEPPHYDGIQSLAMSGTTLFSGSRDTSIKKWDMKNQTLKQALNSAHKDWITALQFLPGSKHMLSGCRGGYLKLWHVDSCRQVSKIQAHPSGVSAIANNSSCVFTASNEQTIGVWKPRATGWDFSDVSDTVGDM